ncbi:F0F1 ATP synthase subunit delta [Virgibacillus siamensis]|uniref:F0F1 ATP synthase subunit delta n=1 Tax=Virgibacillus siamensis TaxID=480071 RepID=UPI000987C109|nr:F0F1 ATP synthase subunit delta [Virgibacillus siamensis]
MSEAIANRYADALFQLANEQGKTEQLMKEFSVLEEVFQENQELDSFLKHPRVSNDKKKQFLDEVFKDFSTDVRNTLKILVERHRIEVIPSMIDHYTKLVNDAKGIVEATVYSVRKLSDAEREQIEKSFAKRLNKQTVKLENIVDPSVLGGVKVRVGNSIYDGTISNKLQRLERNIVFAN